MPFDLIKNFLFLSIIVPGVLKFVSAPKTVDPNVASLEKTCPFNSTCSDLPANCFDCDYNYTCVYGSNVSVTCTVKDQLKCQVSGSSNRVDSDV